MAHNLSTDANGKHAMFYYGEVPWHRLGQRLDNPATSAEAYQAAGLGWTADLHEIQTVGGVAIPTKRAVMRSDTGAVLGVVSPMYQPVQNSEAFDFLDALVADGSLRYHTAGALGFGERVWMLAKLPGEIRVKGHDTVEKFLLLANAHDGTQALRVMWTPIRVVCQNTLTFATSRNLSGAWISHKGDLRAKLNEARHILGLAERFYADTEVKMQAMASHTPTKDQVTTYFETLYPDPITKAEQEAKAAAALAKKAEAGKGKATGQQAASEATIDQERTLNRRIREELHRLYEEGIDHQLPDLRGTTWCAFNAATQFIDHKTAKGSADRERRTGKAPMSKKTEWIWFGAGAQTKRKA